MSIPLLSIAIQFERDIVTARRRARQIAEALSFDQQDQARIATAVSEIARNALSYAGGGKIEFIVDNSRPHHVLLIRVQDKGPGITNLQQILSGRYHSSTGMGLGIIGAHRLMDGFEIETAPGKGTVVLLRKLLPKRKPSISPQEIMPHIDRLMQPSQHDPSEELHQQNQELLRVLDELQSRQDELMRLNQELEDTNRGVVALYAELDEKAERLRQADELKSRFLSYMSHEFRTPLNSILALSRLLLARFDGDLTPEQEKQVTFMQKAAEDLTELVNDLLDLAKVEAGRVDIHPAEFDVTELFGALRGLLRPIVVSDAVSLIFEIPGEAVTLYTDQGKLSQILRNFISNALKFTEHGEVRISLQLSPDGTAASFAVADTGIGIAPEHQGDIFQEFTQVNHSLQKRVKGTGLGLPLSKKLAELLGGTVTLESLPGVGSTFTVTIPRVFGGGPLSPAAITASLMPDRSNRQGVMILSVDDEDVPRYLLKRLLSSTGYTVVEASNGSMGLEMARRQQPDIVFLDLMMPEMSGMEVLRHLRADDATRAVPVIILTSQTLSEHERGTLESNTSAILAKNNLTYETVMTAIMDALPRVRANVTRLKREEQ